MRRYHAPASRRSPAVAVVLAACSWAAPFVGAQSEPGPAGLRSAAVDKHRFTLFRPTPREAMREMSTDRPDATESPITVDAGHVQVEVSLIDYARRDDAGARTTALSVLPANVKFGLSNDVDVQLVFTPHTRVEEGAHGSQHRVAGFSDDTQIRLKINLWGNDGPHPTFGDTAFGIMPFIKLPTGAGELSNDHVEGGLIFPFAAALPAAWELGVIAEFDFVFDERAGGYGIHFVHTTTTGHEVPAVAGLGFFVEYLGVAPFEGGGEYQAIASGGLTYAVSEDWGIDGGGQVGLSDSADDFTIFVGTSLRF